MNEWVEEKILILVKTYPNPSAKYIETVCTAGITEKGKLIRIYPVQFRHLNDNQKYQKAQWIKAKIIKNEQDHRPESYRIDDDSIILLNKLDASKDNAEKTRIITPFISESLEAILNNHKKDGTSLGIFKPAEFYDIILEKTSDKWTDKELLALNQITIDDKEVKQLEKIPYDFTFRFKCTNKNCNGHSIKSTDWELCQTYRNFIRLYGEEQGIIKLKEKWIGMFNDPKTDFYFVTGTVHSLDRFGTFILIGFLNLKIEKFEQLSLF